jgi:hypothetical protein
MDQRYERLRCFHRVSRKTKLGLGYYEPWHKYGSFEKPRKDRYKNIDSTTIRKAPLASSVFFNRVEMLLDER